MFLWSDQNATAPSAGAAASGEHPLALAQSDITLVPLQDIADAIAQMHEKARYRQLLLFVETCEAETLTEKVYSPDVLTIATSKLGALLCCTICLGFTLFLPGHTR